MKIRLSLPLALLAAAIIVNGCKTTISDPTYVALAEIRFADFHQQTPLKIFVYPDNATHDDSATWTPAAMTYGIVTPYFTTLQTNRNLGKHYHLAAFDPSTNSIAASADITLMPGDKLTWLITGPGGSYKQEIINDNPSGTQNTSLSYFRFVNTSSDHTPLDLRVNDPLNGFAIAQGIAYDVVSPYVGLPTALDTTITLFVVQNGTVLGRLAGVGLPPGAYQTVTWGGQDTSGNGKYRQRDPITGQFILNDTTRIRIWDDDKGVDQTYTPPQYLRFNIINALLPPNAPNTDSASKKSGLIDYTLYGGLNININNNTIFDYTGLDTFSFAPKPLITSPPDVPYVVPTSVLFNPATDKIFVSMVKPAGATPSLSDSVLFRFYAGLTGATGSLKDDYLYTIVVYDTVKKSNDPKQSDYNAPYDSSAGVATIPVPDVPVAGAAKLLVGFLLAPPNKPLAANSNTTPAPVFTVNGITMTKLKTVKNYDTITVAPGPVNLEGKVNTDTDVIHSFNAVAGGIYEAFLVGQRGRHDHKVPPRWIVVRVNP